MAQLPVGYGVPIGFNANGLPQPQGLPAMPVENEVKYAPNASNMPKGVSPALALAFGAQNAGAGVNAQGQPVGGGGQAGVAPQMSQVQAMPQQAQVNPATGLPSYFDPNWYVQNNPDVLAGFNSQTDKGEGMGWYGTQHYSNFAKGDGGQRYLGPNDPAYLARTQHGLSTAPGTKPSDAQMQAYSAMSPEDQVNLINFLKGMGLA